MALIHPCKAYVLTSRQDGNKCQTYRKIPLVRNTKFSLFSDLKLLVKSNRSYKNEMYEICTYECLTVCVLWRGMGRHWYGLQTFFMNNFQKLISHIFHLHTHGHQWHIFPSTFNSKSFNTAFKIFNHNKNKIRKHLNWWQTYSFRRITKRKAIPQYIKNDKRISK